MTERKTNSPLLRAARRDWDKAKLIEQANSTKLLRLSIVMALATLIVIACVAWLLS